MKKFTLGDELRRRLTLPSTQTTTYLLKLFFIGCAGLVLLEVVLQKCEFGNVHVYNVHKKLAHFIHLSEPCYPAYQKERFDFLRHALVDFKEVAEEIDLRFWLEFGTMLGATRYGTFIPWDYDMDLAVVKEEFLPKLDRFRALMKKRGLDVLRQPTGCKYLVLKNNTGKAESEELYRFDVFMFTPANQHQSTVFYQTFKQVQRVQLIHDLKKSHVGGGKMPKGGNGIAMATAKKPANTNPGSELLTRCGLPDWYRYTMPRKYIDDMVEVKFEGTTAPIPRDAKEMIRYYRYPNSYWMAMPYKIQCYVTEPRYMWVTAVFLIVFVMPCTYILWCRFCRSKEPA
eukprot:scpid53815/ scgid28501/ 